MMKLMKVEGPSPEDLARFGSEEGYCPECGEVIWDQAEFCPACSAPLGGRTLSRPPEKYERRRTFFIIVAVIVLVAFFFVVAIL